MAAHLFDPLHKGAPRTFAHGKLAAAIFEHKHVELPDGTSVHHAPGGFHIKNRAGYVIEFHPGNKNSDHAHKVAGRVLDLSAKSKHRNSIGGVTSFATFDHFKKARRHNR
jgi:hypothetical protein